MKTYTTLIILLLSIISYSQNTFFNNEEKAYMYHVVMKSPVLKRNLSEYFEYKGDTIYKKDTIIDYQYIENKIKDNPELLNIRLSYFSYESAGIISELSTKMALWMLQKAIIDGVEDNGNDVIYINYINEISQIIPSKYVKINGEKRTILTKYIKLLNPNLSANERIEQLTEYKNLSIEEQKLFLEAINQVTKVFVERKSYELFLLMGGNRGDFTSLLMAAGDGSKTNGLLDAKEKDNDKKKRNVGIGLFNYHYKIDEIKPKQKKILVSKLIQDTFQTIGNNTFTKLHTGIWGFNYNYQTTVSIQCNKKTYLLYGNKKTKELSPDSTFGEGVTIHQQLKLLKNKIIPTLEEEIHGEDGWIAKRDYYTDKKLEYANTIRVLETDLTTLNMALKKNKKKIKQTHQKLDQYHSRYITNIENIKKSEEKLKLTEQELKCYQNLYDEYAEVLYKNTQEYKQFAHIFTFEDRSTFNIYTQDFVFADSNLQSECTVTLIAIGERIDRLTADEVQLFASAMKGKREDKSIHPLDFQFLDVFKSDKYKLEDSLAFNHEQKYELKKMLKHIIENDADIKFEIVGNGIGKIENDLVVRVKNQTKSTLPSSPGNSITGKQASRMSDEFKNLRVSILKVDYVNNDVLISINSYTDPVKSNLLTKNPKVKEIFSEQELENVSQNEILSGLRSSYILSQFQIQLLNIAKEVLPSKSYSKLQKKVDKGLHKKKVKLNEDVSVYYIDILNNIE